MADNQTGLNAQYQDPPFGAGGDYTSTGAAGTEGITAPMTAGAVVGRPVVSVPFASSQLPENMPRADVLAGDTCSLSSDAPVPPGGDPLTGLSLAQVTQTGAGMGSVSSPHHPTGGFGLDGVRA